MDKKLIRKFIAASAAICGTAFVGMKIAAAVTKNDRQFNSDPKQRNPFEGKKVIFVEDENDAENADGVRGHLEAVGDCIFRPSFYDKYVKRAIDITLSFGGLIILSPVLASIAIAIMIDDPGPVLFTQKRVGQNKKYFKLYKFRSMKMCTPHDVPTHMLENPDQYITKVGKYLRAHSLDELPQIWNVFVGVMSVVGPRPGIWNQDVLTAERDKYGANDIKPGITGWAQINGRDAIEIPEKAKLDGEYVMKESFIFDIKCIIGTVSKVGRDDTVIEGGTGEMKKSGRSYTDGKSDKELIGHIGFGEPVEVDRQTKKRVLITGAGSYVGESFKKYAAEYYSENFDIEELNMLEASWEKKNFSDYDVVYHVAGIAHADVGNVSEEVKQRYYSVNTDLAVDVARKAKSEGVKEFIFMSSMIIYGDPAPYGKKKVATENTVPVPSNFYGDSKLQADVAVRDLADDTFTVIVLRPPMIYGKGSKGNYPTLAKIAKILPVFPKVDNERSVLYIENFCEFLCQIMLIKVVKENAIVLFPQNAEWTKTSEMVKEIAHVSGRDILEVKVMRLAVMLGGKVPGKIGELVNKAFGNNCYVHSMSTYSRIDYHKQNLKESIERTEGNIVFMSEEPILVSIITVSFNSENTIRKTIESILNQTYPYIEYRIVDGLSSDDTVSIAHEYDEQFASRGMKYIVTSEKDNGIYDAMNKGIKDASGKVIGIINSDDWYESNAIETVINTYKRTNFDYYYADIKLVKEDGSVIVKHSKKDHIVTSRHWNHPSCFVTKQLYDELGVFLCEGIHDDFDFFLRVKKAEKKIIIENKIIANFKVGGISNEKSFRKCKKRCTDRFRCYRNNRYSPLYFFECMIIEVAKYLIS